MVARAMELTPIARMIASSARGGAPQARHQSGFYYGRETFPNEGAEKAGVTGQMWLGIISSATMLFLAAPAFADACLFQPRRPFQLSSDTVEWTMLIASGRTCTQGLRLGSMNITSVKLIAPPQSGKVDIKGPSFSYAAKADFQGQDEFTIQVSGTVVRIAGVSDVKVTVSVVDK
jgi:hypothetical protein